MRVFISYSSKDREPVRALSDDLESLGHIVWFDKELSRTGGQHWWSNILTNVRDCDLFIFALTPNALASAACQLEYHYAAALNKRILPLMLMTSDINTLPPELQELQFVDYREHTSRQALALAGSLNSLPPAQPLPDPLPPEPDAPLSPMARLTQRIEAQSLPSTDQMEIVYELEAMQADPLTRASAESLMHRLQQRRDLVYSVGQHLERLLETPSSVPSAPKVSTPQQQSQPTSGSVPMRGLAVLAVVVVIAIAGVALILSQAQKQQAASDSTETIVPSETSIEAQPSATTRVSDTPRPSFTSTAAPTEDTTCQLNFFAGHPAVPVYRGPGTDYPQLTQFTGSDQHIPVIGRTSDGGWLQVKLSGNQSPGGWVEANRVQPEGACDGLPIGKFDPPPSPTPQPQPQQQQATRPPPTPRPK